MSRFSLSFLAWALFLSMTNTESLAIRSFRETEYFHFDFKIAEKCFISSSLSLSLCISLYLWHSLFFLLGVLSFSLRFSFFFRAWKSERVVARYPINSLCVWWERSTITFAFMTLDSRSIPVLPRSSFSFAAGARRSLPSPPVPLD